MMMVWGEILFKKQKKKEKKGKKKKKKREKKEKLLKIEYGFGYGLTHGLSMLFFPFVENNIFFFSSSFSSFFFFKEKHCMFNLPFLSIGLFVMTPLSAPSPFPNESHVKLITGLTASSFYFQWRVCHSCKAIRFEVNAMKILLFAKW